jgi:hypothetical protein
MMAAALISGRPSVSHCYQHVALLQRATVSCNGVCAVQLTELFDGASSLLPVQSLRTTLCKYVGGFPYLKFSSLLRSGRLPLRFPLGRISPCSPCECEWQRRQPSPACKSCKICEALPSSMLDVSRVKPSLQPQRVSRRTAFTSRASAAPVIACSFYSIHQRMRNTWKGEGRRGGIAHGRLTHPTAPMLQWHLIVPVRRRGGTIGLPHLGPAQRLCRSQA